MKLTKAGQLSLRGHMSQRDGEERQDAGVLIMQVTFLVLKSALNFLSPSSGPLCPRVSSPAISHPGNIFHTLAL